MPHLWMRLLLHFLPGTDQHKWMPPTVPTTTIPPMNPTIGVIWRLGGARRVLHEELSGAR